MNLFINCARLELTSQSHLQNCVLVVTHRPHHPQHNLTCRTVFWLSHIDPIILSTISPAELCSGCHTSNPSSSTQSQLQNCVLVVTHRPHHPQHNLTCRTVFWLSHIDPVILSTISPAELCSGCHTSTPSSSAQSHLQNCVLVVTHRPHHPQHNLTCRTVFWLSHIEPIILNTISPAELCSGCHTSTPSSSTQSRLQNCVLVVTHRPHHPQHNLTCRTVFWLSHIDPIILNTISPAELCSGCHTSTPSSSTQSHLQNCVLVVTHRTHHPQHNLTCRTVFWLSHIDPIILSTISM